MKFIRTLVLLLLAASCLFGQRMPPAVAPDRPLPERPALSREILAAPVAASARLSAASEGAGDSLAALRAWNEAGRTPYRDGFARTLRAPLVLKRGGGRAIASAEAPGVRARVDVAGAEGLRLHVAKFSLPPGTDMWVWSDGATPIWFNTSLAGGASEFWTPSVWSDHINFAISAPPGDYEIELDSVLQYVAPGRGPQIQSTECLIDGACPGTNILDVVAQYRKAVAHLRYVNGAESYICSGALIIDSAQSFTPYLLTANHCLSTQAEASSLEAYWDYIASSCGAAPPNPATVPRSNSSTLLSTSAATDVTLVRLSAIPSGRIFLGWTADAGDVPNGAILHRLSHPEGLPMAYSVTRVDTSVGTCETKGRPSYIYSTSINGGGGVAGGSSGSPVILAGGYIVGQLFGHCGPEPGNACNGANNTVDGALSASFPLLAAYLSPSTTCSACVPDAKTACLLGNRFKVTMPNWTDSGAGLSGQGSIIKYADNVESVHPTFGPLSASAFFSMYSFAPSSIEALVRMIKGQNQNNKYWVFLTGFAGASYTVRIEDTQTCTVWQRQVPAKATNVVKDFEAFAFP
ncbi:MAG TPA: hypothetical protein VLV48_00825 [Thermoanaerobaculia bacterium]|nr:hypothetical protein [Thermoanaerobaculia bacterium]